MINIKPELLAPAGNLDKLKTAFLYGADAVYIGGEEYSLRVAADNFSIEDMREGVAFAHNLGKKVYLTANIIPHNKDLKDFAAFLKEAVGTGVDAVIISDLGLFSIAREVAPELDIHVSTQANNVNYASAETWYKLGAKRVILARELSLKEISEIRENTNPDLELEAFVHGAMCISYSGRCLLSNYMTERDSNLGACAHPCRWKYSLVEETRPGEYFPVFENERGTFIYNSKDLCMIEHIPEMIDAGITSFKIEGRAKSAYYVAVVTNAYRMAIDAYCDNPRENYMPEQWILDEMRKVSYRDYCTGFYYGDVADDANISYKGGYNREWDVMAVVEKWENGVAYCSQRNRFFEDDVLEAMNAGEKPFEVIAKCLRNEEGERIPDTRHPMMKFTFECETPLKADTLLRKCRDEAARVII